MAKKAEVAIYTCKTCGKVTTIKGHLCTPIPAKKAVVCSFCGTITADPRHVCAPKVVSFKYVCDACGRLAITRSLLCKPKEIASKTTQKITASKKPVKKK